MKSKEQKQVELKKAETALTSSQALIFVDFSKISTEDFRRLRKDIKNKRGNVLIIKKRLFNLLLKKYSINFDLLSFKLPIGIIFSGDKEIDDISGVVFKFFSSLPVSEEISKDELLKKIIGGYSISSKTSFDSQAIIALGKLPPREILLSQLVGIISFPIRSFLYVLKQKTE